MILTEVERRIRIVPAHEFGWHCPDLGRAIGSKTLNNPRADSAQPWWWRRWQ